MLRKALAICCLLSAIAMPAGAASVRPLALEQIIADAAIAFEGICVDNRVDRDPQTGMIATYTTFEVLDVLKGEVAATHTIKQVGGKIGKEVFRIEGVPTFTPGREYVVFLFGVSQAGFSSPVGLSQGQFLVRHGPLGREVSNGRDFKEMLRTPGPRIPQSAIDRVHQRPGEQVRLDLEEFKQIVRQSRGSGR